MGACAAPLPPLSSPWDRGAAGASGHLFRPRFWGPGSGDRPFGASGAAPTPPLLFRADVRAAWIPVSRDLGMLSKYPGLGGEADPFSLPGNSTVFETLRRG